MWNPFRRRPVALQPEPLTPEQAVRAEQYHTWSVTR